MKMHLLENGYIYATYHKATLQKPPTKYAERLMEFRKFLHEKKFGGGSVPESYIDIMVQIFYSYFSHHKK